MNPELNNTVPLAAGEEQVGKGLAGGQGAGRLGRALCHQAADARCMVYLID